MEDVDEPVTVALVSNSDTRLVKPAKIKWRNRIYAVTEVCMHSILPEKGIPHHIYSLIAGGCHMIISMNSQTLLWTLQKVGSLE